MNRRRFLLSALSAAVVAATGLPRAFVQTGDAEMPSQIGRLALEWFDAGAAANYVDPLRTRRLLGVKMRDVTTGEVWGQIVEIVDGAINNPAALRVARRLLRLSAHELDARLVGVAA